MASAPAGTLVRVLWIMYIANARGFFKLLSPTFGKLTLNAIIHFNI